MDANKDKIKSILRDAGVTQTQVAEILRVSVAAVHYVVSGKKKNPRIRKAIALFVKKNVSDLWPDKEQNDSREAA